MKTIRIALVDDHILVREGIRTLLSMVDHFEIAGEAGSGSEALELVAREQPDILLMDIGLKDINGLELTGNPRRVNLRISDDGTGFSPRQAEQSGGIGLRNIRERVEHFGGDFSIASTSAGTVLSVALLLSAEVQQPRNEPA